MMTRRRLTKDGARRLPAEGLREGMWNLGYVDSA
jgi:hypothetical protein